MFRVFVIVVIGLLLVLLVLWVQVQKVCSDVFVKLKKLFCWNQGNEWICSDVLFQDVVNVVCEEFSVNSGLCCGEVQCVMIEEECVGVVVEVVQCWLDLVVEQICQCIEQVMLFMYENEVDLCWVFVECIGILDNNIQIVYYNVVSLCDVLVMLLLMVGNCELVGLLVVDKQVVEICQCYIELLVQK